MTSPTPPEVPAEFQAAAEVFGGQTPPDRGASMPTLAPIEVAPRTQRTTTPEVIDLRDDPTPEPASSSPRTSTPAPKAKRKRTPKTDDQTTQTRVGVVISQADLAQSQTEAEELNLFHIGYVRASLAVFAPDLKAPSNNAGLYTRKRAAGTKDPTRGFRLRPVDLKYLDDAVSRTGQTRSWVIRQCLKAAAVNRTKMESFLAQVGE